MPISSIISYPPTMADFGLHWEQVNTALNSGGGTELLLPGGYGLTQFQTDRDAIVAALSGFQNLLNDYELALADRDNQRENMRDRIVNFRKTIGSKLPDSRYLRALPDTPQEAAAEGKILAALDDMASLWGKISADTSIAGFTPPLLLRGSYSLEGFTADVAELRNIYQAVASATRELKLAREDRNRLLDAAYERLKQYRACVIAELEETDPLLQSLPDLVPAPGSTPDAVTATAVWESATSQVKITWTESTDPNLANYQVRYVTDSEYNTDNEALSGTIPPTAPREFFTLDGILGPTSTASYKVYVILNTGNEKGSNAVSVNQGGL